MIKTKRKSITIVTLILIGLFFFSGISTATSISTDETLGDENPEIESLTELEEEEYIQPSYETTETEWRPIEETLSFNSINTESDIDSQSAVSYDSTTKVETTFSNSESLKIPSPSLLKEYKGIMAEAADYEANKALNSQEAVITPDGRTRITPATGYPWRTIVKLYITADDASTWIGSGVMIDDIHCLSINTAS